MHLADHTRPYFVYLFLIQGTSDEATNDRRAEDVKELVETVISDSWSFPDLRP